ncbi:MAG: phosphotransferase [Nocardioidaceae bacterium]
MHEGQVDLSLEVARQLIDDQFPSWRHLPVRMVTSSGTLNRIVRIGDRLAARFPLVVQEPTAAREALRSEAAAARELAECSPVPAPVPVAFGEPGPGYPLPWAVQTWVPGRIATDEDPAGSDAFAEDLAGFIARLRACDTKGRRFSGGGRGGELPDHDDWVQLCLERSTALLDVRRLGLLWRELRVLPRVGSEVMSHGDLVPGNVLVDAGRLVGVIDGGGFGPADLALDLVGGWHLLDPSPREVLRRSLGCGDVEWLRGKAWALVQALGLVWYYVDSNPVMSGIGRRTLDRVLAMS